VYLGAFAIYSTLNAFSPIIVPTSISFCKPDECSSYIAYGRVSYTSVGEGNQNELLLLHDFGKIPSLEEFGCKSNNNLNAI
jgi:hypothetical protein